MTEERKGEWYLVASSAIWAVFPVLTVLTYGVLPSIVSLAWSTVFATLFFFVLLVFKNKWHELLNWKLWQYTFGIVLFLGVLYYVFLYLGLSKTTPGNVSILDLGEVFTSFVFFHLIRKEFISKSHMFGAFLTVVGASIVLFPGYSTGHRTGDLLVLLAVCFPPIGNYFQQKARKIASAETIMFLRELLAVPFLFLLAYLFNMHADSGAVRHALPLLLVSGIFLFGISKIFWVEAIHRISVTKANALYLFGPPLTLLLAWLILHQTPTLWQLLCLPFFIVGVLFLTDTLTFKSRKPI
jgi:drug/metabolite transporter (DMT)-like permease